MPKGVHTSIRVALAVPPKLHEQLKVWADYEGRPVASLCMYLIENSLRAAQRDGIAPSFGNEVSTEERIGKWEGYRHSTTAPEDAENKRFTQFMEDKIAASKFKEERKEETKAEKLLALLQELTND
jgi:hypothetical protein